MKAIISQVSELDSSGNVQVGFNVTKDNGELLFPNLMTQGPPDQIKPNMIRMATTLKQQMVDLKALKVGDEVNI